MNRDINPFQDEVAKMQEWNNFVIKLTKDCFNDCVFDFTKTKISLEEGQCVHKCTTRSLK